MNEHAQKLRTFDGTLKDAAAVAAAVDVGARRAGARWAADVDVSVAVAFAAARWAADAAIIPFEHVQHRGM